MSHLINTEELNAQAEIAAAEKLLGIAPSDAGAGARATTGSKSAEAQPRQAPAPEGANSPSAALDESDDGVEALIVSMDTTTLEHVFLQAQRQIQQEAANALDDEHR